jgi:hypothetical protein
MSQLTIESIPTKIHFIEPSATDIAAVEAQTAVERDWYSGFHRFETDADIYRALGRGTLLEILPNDNLRPVNRFITRNPRPATLLPFAALGLEVLGQLWRYEANNLGVSSNVVLAGTSFTRPQMYQDELVADSSALAVKDSSHTKGGTVDIDGRGYFLFQHGETFSVSLRTREEQIALRKGFIEKYGGELQEDTIIGPEGYDENVAIALEATLGRMGVAGAINHVEEFPDSPGTCHHIAFNPDYWLKAV